MDVVQQWANNSPRVQILGSYYQLDSYCSVNVTEIGNVDECMPVSGPTTATTTSSPTEKATPGLLGIGERNTIIMGSVVGGVVTIIILVVIAALVLGCRRTRQGQTSIKSKDGFSPL